jgi:hypothetical protein
MEDGHCGVAGGREPPLQQEVSSNSVVWPGRHVGALLWSEHVKATPESTGAL